MIRTYLDETSIAFGDANSDSIRDAIEDLVEVIQAINDRMLEHGDEELVQVGAIFDTEVRPGDRLVDFLYPADAESTLRDVRLQLSTAIDRISTLDEGELDAERSVSLCNGTLPSRALAQVLASSARPPLPVPILALATTLRRGRTETSIGGVVTPLWFVTSAADRTAFIRAWLSTNPPSPQELAEFRSRAFPELQWRDGAIEGMRHHKSVFFGEHFSTTLHHLGVLNDESAQLFTAEINNDQRQARLSALGVNASPESPKTRANRKAAAQRLHEWMGRDIHFWWHTKIRYNQGRIHFHHAPGQDNEVGACGSIVIGIFVDHLRV